MCNLSDLPCVALLTRQTGREYSVYSALFSLHTSLALVSSQPANMMKSPLILFQHSPLEQR